MKSEDHAPNAPLAERMRPRDLEELLGQEDILGPGTLLRGALERDELDSIILWGPPGSGKTTLARIVASRTRCRFVPFSAVVSGIREIKGVMREAEDHRRMFGQRSILFVDEIHRFNKAQQDAFLPPIERGEIILIGATTENPSFEVNAALLSRTRVYVLKPLGRDEIVALLRRAISDPRGLGGRGVAIEDPELGMIADASQGDARAALTTLDFAAAGAPGGSESAAPPPGDPSEPAREPPSRTITRKMVIDALRRGALYYDKGGEQHYDQISALHKSLRNSDPQAAVYWLARMLESGEDPMYVARRMVRFASEDVGNADPRALTLALAAKDAAHFLGMPEASDALAQAAVYLATAPKSNAVTLAYAGARRDIRSGRTGAVPMAIRNAATRLMKELGYGEGYVYAHDTPGGVADLTCLPEGLEERRYYEPKDAGFEKTIRERMEHWEREKTRRPGPPGSANRGSKGPDERG